MCDKAVDTHPSITKFALECCKCILNPAMCYKAVHKYYFVFDSILTQEIYSIYMKYMVSLYSFLIVHCSDKHKSQKMCDEPVDDCLVAFNFIPDWFVINNMIKKLHTAFTHMIVYPFLMKIVVILHFVVMQWVFLV